MDDDPRIIETNNGPTEDDGPQDVTQDPDEVYHDDQPEEADDADA